MLKTKMEAEKGYIKKRNPKLRLLTSHHIVTSIHSQSLSMSIVILLGRRCQRCRDMVWPSCLLNLGSGLLLFPWAYFQITAITQLCLDANPG